MIVSDAKIFACTINDASRGVRVMLQIVASLEVAFVIVTIGPQHNLPD
jgi:hypothetical protein